MTLADVVSLSVIHNVNSIPCTRKRNPLSFFDWAFFLREIYDRNSPVDGSNASCNLSYYPTIISQHFYKELAVRQE